MQLNFSSVSMLALAVFCSAVNPALAQDAQSDRDGLANELNASEDESGAEIVVLATRIRGSVESGQPPVATFDESDIAALGVGSLQDLLGAIAPQAGSGRGRGDGQPVVLLNGVRVSGFREMRNLPPEAIRKVEVLPEEVALKYGYRADQRVVNFILKDDFRSVTVDAEARIPGGGGFSEQELETSLASIANGARVNVTGKVMRTSPLTEAERGIAQPDNRGSTVPGDPDQARYRTLIDDAQAASLNATWARSFGGGASLSLNGNVEKQTSKALLGLDSVTLTGADQSTFYRTILQGEGLARNVDRVTAQAGAAYNRPVGKWSLSATADYSHVTTRTTTDRSRDLGGLQQLVASGMLEPDGLLPLAAAITPERARSASNKVATLATLVGQPFRLPAGDASLTLKAGYAYAALSSNDSRNGGAPDANLRTSLRRGDASGGFSIDLPVTSRREGFGAGIGDLSFNLNADANRLSDFGTLWGYGAGLTWSPAEKLTLQASYMASEAAPGLLDLGAPTVVTPSVSIYDFARGETVQINITSGGNSNLLRETQRDLKFAVNWELPGLRNSNLIAEYFRNRSYDTTNDFPLLTPAIEAAFPERIARDATGRLISIDQRAVTFAQEASERLRFGLNVGGSFGKPDPNARRSPFAGMARGGRSGGVSSASSGSRQGASAGMRGGATRGGGMGGSGDGRGRWNLALYHTVRLAESVQITSGGPVLDLLDGAALTGGGVARHSVELEGGAFYRGFGLRMNGTYTGGTRVDGNGLPGSSRIDFSPLATLNLRVFADLGRMDSVTEAVPFLKGSRVSLKVDNVFDAQQRVRDASGIVPLRYQPGYLDPRGRVFELEFRKQF